MSDEEEFLLDDELVQVVLFEARESLEEAMRLLKSEVSSPDAVGALFRCFHSIKGNTAMVQRLDVSKGAHLVEDYLEKVRSSGRLLRADEVDGVLELADMLGDAIQGGEAALYGLRGVVACLEANALGPCPDLTPKSGPGSQAGPSPPRSSYDGAEDGHGVRSTDREQNVLKVEASAIFEALEVAGELFQIDERLKYFVNRTHLESGSSYRELEARGLTQLEREFDTAVDQLYELLLDVQRLPVSHVAAPLERALRDICRATGKEIELDTQGRDLRIDKQILQTLRDPLMHMVRNSADHGVEHPSEREKLGKPRLAKIALTFEDLEDLVRVTVRDDGAGIHIEKVKQRALACGLVTQLAVEQLSVEQVIDFIFQPGFSTAQEVSDLSGRGVGMDVVASQIRAAGGRHKTATVQGQGTTFVLELPKPGSPVLDGLAVRRGEMVYIVPMKQVLSFIGRPDMRILRRTDGQVLARVGTTHHAVVHAPGDQSSLGLENARTIGVFIEAAPGQRVVMPVDDVLGRRRALIQSVDTFDGPTANGQKACILGDGTMAVALDTSVLVEDPELIFCVDGELDLGLSLEQERERSREAAA